MNVIIYYCIVVFITQFIFIGCRTWNVAAIAEKNIPAVIISGAFIHIAWLVSIAIGAVSMNELISNFDLNFLPVVFCSLTGGVLSSYIVMKYKERRYQKQFVK